MVGNIYIYIYVCVPSIMGFRVSVFRVMLGNTYGDVINKDQKRLTLEGHERNSSLERKALRGGRG